MSWLSQQERQFDTGVAYLTEPRGAPRLHWGGFLGSALGGLVHGAENVGSAIKKGVIDVGHVAGTIASNPLVDAGIGAFLGPGAAAAAGGLGRLIAPGGNVGNAAVGAGTGYLAGKGGSLLRNLLAGPSGAGANPDPNGGVADASAGGDGSQSWLQSLLHGAEGVGGTLLNGAKNAVSGSGPGGLSLPVLGLAGAQVANAAQLGAKGNDYADKAFNLSNDSYGSRAGLRSAGIAGLSTSRPMQDLSGLTAIRNRNPVAGGLRSATGA